MELWLLRIDDVAGGEAAVPAEPPADAAPGEVAREELEAQMEVNNAFWVIEAWCDNCMSVVEFSFWCCTCSLILDVVFDLDSCYIATVDWWVKGHFDLISRAKHVQPLCQALTDVKLLCFSFNSSQVKCFNSRLIFTCVPVLWQWPSVVGCTC